MRALVVSNEVSTRTTYFIQAGKEVGVDTRFITYDELESGISGFEEVLIKLEPPVYQEAGFTTYHKLCKAFIDLLERIARTPINGSVRFLNSPEAIISTLDKLKSKEQLSGWRTTPLISSTVCCFEELITLLSERNCSKVFVKPRYGSGAGGIMALRLNKRTGELVAYTTLSLNGKQAYNTKRINRFTDVKAIALLANTVLQEGALVEKWLFKDTLHGENYDLRVVAQFGRVAHIVARCSKGPITNLHLNNRAKTTDQLDFTDALTEEISRMGIGVVQSSGLQYGGVDILIERDTRLPYIIEVNGQGDHIHQDMYHGNSIYKEQLSGI